MTKNHEDDSTGSTRLERFQSGIPAQSKGRKQMANVYRAIICTLCCISDIGNIEEMMENKTCGLEVETVWYLTLKVKNKIRESFDHITRG